MEWVSKDDVKERCSLFDIFGARLAKYVNDEVRDARTMELQEIEDELKFKHITSLEELQKYLEKRKKEIK